MTEIAQDVLAVLSTLEIDGNAVRITEQLDRKLYLAVYEVLNRIGGRWTRQIKAHVFETDPTSRLNNVIECGVLNPKVKTGYFPTPPEIVEQMIELADLNRHQLILEPSAGQGHISDIICKRLNIHTHEIMVCEILPENVNILKEKGYRVEELGFLEFADECDRLDVQFDRIVMNPPFENQNDVLHVTTAFGLLKPGGILVAIMASGVTFRQNKKTLEFKENILDPYCTYLEKLPEGAFKSSGTMVNTIMLRLEK